MIRLLGFLLAASGAAAAAGPPPEGADELGRLFTTPEQRQLLDRPQTDDAKNTEQAAEQTSEQITEQAAPPPAPAPPRLDGIVLRGERPVACWLDGVWQPEGDKCPPRP